MTIPPSLAQPSFSQAPIESTDPNAISKTIVDAKGDLIAGTADNAVSRQPAGSNGTFLTADSAQSTGLAWVANPVDTAFDAKGDILVGTGPDTYVKLPVGTTNQVLVADSTQASGVKWSSEQDPNAIVKSIVDAKGDLIAATANDTPARLAVGTDNQLLIADSTQTTGLKWGRPDITLGTETTGNYVAGITGGTGVTVTGSGSEGATPSVAIGQSVGTGDTVAFGGLNVDSGTLYVDSTNNRVGINDTTPSYSLDVTGDGHFTTDLTVDGTIYGNINGDFSGALYMPVKNTYGSTLTKGTPVYITGTVGSTQVAEIAPSRADTSSTMPSVGILTTDLAHNATGSAAVIGLVPDINTSTYTLNQPLFVGATGGLTNTQPTSSSHIVQMVAYAARINTNNGILLANIYDQARTQNSISISGNIATTGGQFSGSGAGLTSIPASQLSGTVPSTNIGNDSVALGTKTTGDYVATVTGGTGVTVTGGTGEGSSPSIAIGQAVGTSDSPTFTGLTTLSNASLYSVGVTAGLTANSLSASTVSGTTLTVNGKQIDTTGATSNQVLKFNGTKFAPNTVDASELSGTTLASGVTSSSLTSLGVLTGLAMATGTANLANIDAVGTITAHASSTQDGVKLQGRAGGSSSANVTLTPTTLTGNRTLTLPDKTGTVATTADLGLVYITETNATSGSTVDITSCFSSAYDSYRIIISDFRASTAANILSQLLATSTPATTNYAWGVTRVDYLGALTGVGSGFPATVAYWNFQMVGGTTSSSFVLELQNPFLSQPTYVQWDSTDNRGTSGYAVMKGGGTHTTASSYNGIRLSTTAGTFTNAKIRVYGYRQT